MSTPLVVNNRPFIEPPALGQLIEVAEGILWTRMPLPLQLDHVNIYLIEDDDGFVIVDSGWPDGRTMSIWQNILSGPLSGRRITRVITTHHHPDHIGCTGWLVGLTGADLVMTEIEYLLAAARGAGFFSTGREVYQRFYMNHGLSRHTASAFLDISGKYAVMTAALPVQYTAVRDHDRLTIGGRTFAVRTAAGHSNHQLLLYGADQNVFLSVDQVLPDITPNISVWPSTPNSSPLGDFLDSLADLAEYVPDDALVLPGHRTPFVGIRDRIVAISNHHMRLCDRIAGLCSDTSRSAADIAATIFNRPLDDRNTGLAFSETLAHVKYMTGKNRLCEIIDSADHIAFRTISG